MSVSTEKIQAVPTNIITGFLGVGKTSAIIHLLKHKPENERWAILVNEFGEIGIDGSLFNGILTKTNNVFIKEVAGGCMCCASTLPMQIALNQLLTEAKPHRLLIEPTGLGHPFEVLQLLSNTYYQKSLNLEKTITLIDARQLDDRRYTKHDTFNQQLEVADVIIGNKIDLYKPEDQEALTHYIKDHEYVTEYLHFVTHGKIELEWLEGRTSYRNPNECKQPHRHDTHKVTKVNIPLPPSGIIEAVGEGEDYKSIGWRFAAEKIFDREKLIRFLKNITATRVKAVFITQDGIFGYNNTADYFYEKELDECAESRIEIICDSIDESWKQHLKEAILFINKEESQ